MKIIRKLFMFSAASLFFIAACKKDDGLTAATQTGANTFSCLIDGKLFKPKIGWSTKPLYGRLSTQTKYLIVSANNADENKNIYLYVDGNYMGVGEYHMNYAKGIYATVSAQNPALERQYYSTKYTNNGKINISRSDGNIVSGTFEFIVTNENNPNDKITCTKGRFDIVVEIF